LAGGELRVGFLKDESSGGAPNATRYRATIKEIAGAAINIERDNRGA